MLVIYNSKRLISDREELMKMMKVKRGREATFASSEMDENTHACVKLLIQSSVHV